MTIPNATTNLPSGVTNVVDATAATLGSLPYPDPSRCHSWFNDFDDYDANQWVISETGSGTRAVGNIDGGVLVITNAAADNDRNFLQWSGVTNAAVVETWKWEAGKSMWFKARFKVSDATESDFVMGLQITDTTPLDVTDGFFFSKVDGTAAMTFECEKNDTATSLSVATLSNDTYFTCGFWWDAMLGVLTVYYNDNPVASTTTTTNFCDDEELTLSFGIQNGEGVAKVMSIDYIAVAKDRIGPTAQA
jgi:hypothetical protein